MTAVQLPQLAEGEIYVVTILNNGGHGRIVHRGVPATVRALNGDYGNIFWITRSTRGHRVACSTSEVAPSHIQTTDPSDLPATVEPCRYCWPRER